MLNVPFETLIIHVPENCIDTNYSFGKGKGTNISPDALFEKVVIKRRGGFCFELNGCLSHLLTKLGFNVQARVARVCQNDPNTPGEGNEYIFLAHTHQVLFVKTNDSEETFLVDVGFGGNGLYSPIVLKNGATVKGFSEFETHTLKNEPLPGHPEMPNGWTLYRSHEKENEGRNRAWIHFLDLPILPIDLEFGNWFASTKAHNFSKCYMVSTLDASNKGKKLFLYSEKIPVASFILKDGSSSLVEKLQVNSLQDAKVIWRDHFGINVDY
jgi:arylamine N-acetyltransferase